MSSTNNWKLLVAEGIGKGMSIAKIAKGCRQLMNEPDDRRAYNLVKKEYYRIKRGNAAGVNPTQSAAKAGACPDGTPIPPPKEGVSSMTFRENGDAVFEGFMKLLVEEEVTPESVMRVCNAPPERWVVQNLTCNVWQGMTREGDGNGKMNLWQFKVVMRPRGAAEITLEDVRKEFEEYTATAPHPGHLPVVPVPNRKKSKMLEINISDLHFAKLSWAPECNENYDYKIARDLFFQIIEGEVERLKTGDYEKILFVWTNDFFNSDTIEQTTTAGTQQSTDIRWQKMFLNGMTMLVDAIEILQQYAPVETFYIASNHGRTTEWYGINFLYAWFRDCDRVKVDLSCKARYYYQYGVTLLGFSHSCYEKKQNLPFAMSVEVPEMWASSTYREFHLAHIHCEKVEEKGGVVYRWLPSVTGMDSWHYDSGFIGAFKRSYSFTWDKDIGLESINVVNVKLKPEVK